MDTLTHALSGMLLAQVSHRPGGQVPARAHIMACAAAAAFPDVDYVLMLVDPMGFLNLHRGPTHSLVLLPLWAALLALPLGRILKLTWRTCVTACALGLLAHIIGDWVTLYGTRLFYPLTDHPYALGISFDLNPWIAAVTAAGCLASARWRPRPTAGITLAIIVMLLAGQAALRQQAWTVAAAQARAWGFDEDALYVLPQPLSPTHWALVIPDGTGYQLAYLDLLGGKTFVANHGTSLLGRILAGYRPSSDLVWTPIAGPGQNALASDTWAHPRLSAFRQFAQLPALLEIERSRDVTCVWFTDLRHTLPSLPPTFRYGMCRASPKAEWHPYRLPYYTEGRRQAL